MGHKSFEFCNGVCFKGTVRVLQKQEKNAFEPWRGNRIMTFICYVSLLAALDNGCCVASP